MRRTRRRRIDNYVNQTARIVNDIQNQLTQWGVRDVDINAFYSDLARQVQAIGMTVLQNTFSVLQSVATIMLQLVLVLILSFYFMKDGDRIFGGMLQILPPRWQDEARLLALSVERSFGAFVRGQLIFAFVYGVFTAIVMLFFGLDYVVIASIVAGLSMIIPLVGNFIAFGPPMLVVLVTKPGEWFWVLLWLFIAQSFMMNFVGPRIMSSAIGIHPLYVVGAMLAGGQVAGFWGALFGIPIAGVINLVGRPLMRRLRHQSALYQEPLNPSRLTTRAFVTGPLAARLVEEDQKTGSPGDLAPARPAVEPTRVRMPVPDYDPDFDEPEPRPLTLSGRIWHLAWVFISRAYSWIGTRAHARTSRQ
jgi:predicted PurR-regulated permease PerM